MIDVSEVGAGGGSLIWRDGAGHLKVGPHSAGARPGPACYGRGGTAPTVTDANVVLGYLSPEAIAGGTVPIDADAARRALASVSDGRDLEDLAYGVVQLAATTMMRAVKAVTTFRGRDPRDFTLFAFGGGGGLYAADLARALGIRRVVVPPAAGVFSAVGLLFADLELALSRGFLCRLAAAPAAEVTDMFEELEAAAVAELKVERRRVEMERRIDVRYAGQAFELSVAVTQKSGAPDFAEVGRRFDAEHEATYGHRLPPEHPKEIVALRLAARVPPERPPTLDAEKLLAAARRAPESRRQVYFGGLGRHDTAVIGRADLSAEPRQGPLVIEEYEGTSVVPPDCTARLDGYGNVVIEIG
ncbi:hydantoinase/oxoprolinase family protein [Xanthobacter dioxanivorans]|uniref:hydantoinase/oxoprolinase family protein n=1 Tax=Xanthobacter dioxanivorans TaxID=2528964 RepID=UPI001931E9E8|nr:hydantoinase/oxoprolinase family protein [Xanthobacter dioxanivorans]